MIFVLDNSPINPIMSNSRYNNAAIKIQCFLRNIFYQIRNFARDSFATIVVFQHGENNRFRILNR